MKDGCPLSMKSVNNTEKVGFVFPLGRAAEIIGNIQNSFKVNTEEDGGFLKSKKFTWKNVIQKDAGSLLVTGIRIQDSAVFHTIQRGSSSGWPRVLESTTNRVPFAALGHTQRISRP